MPVQRPQRRTSQRPQTKSKSPNRPKPLTKPFNQMTDAELNERGYIRLPVGPFGIFGHRVTTLQRYYRQEAARSRKEARSRNSRSRPKKKKKWIIPGLIYWK